MSIQSVLFSFILFFACSGSASSDFQMPGINTEVIEINLSEQTLLSDQGNELRPSPLLNFIKKQQNKNRKITAAVLAFPFPFGIVGLHRIYMGCAPYVPVVYIATLGGVFGILPFIDFCVILIEKDLERFMNNPKVFMWVN
jgi:TM2 domain-containing membrane protein YozV